MKIASMKCPHCDSPIEYLEGTLTMKCPSCGKTLNIDEAVEHTVHKPEEHYEERLKKLELKEQERQHEEQAKGKKKHFLTSLAIWAGVVIIISLIGRLFDEKGDYPVLYILVLAGICFGAPLDISISAPVYGKSRLLNLFLFILIYCISFLIILIGMNGLL